jgi:hypothetical protein
MRYLVMSCAVAFGLLVGMLALAQAQVPDEQTVEVATTGGGVLTYHVAVPDATQKRIFITGTITGLDTPSLTLARPWAWAEALPTIEDLFIADGEGTPLAYDLSVVGIPGSDGHHLYTITDTSSIHTVRFSYVVSMTAVVGDYGHGPVAYWHFEPSEYTVIESHLMFLQPLSTTLTALTMTFDLPSDWIPVSRLFARDSYYQAVVTDTVNYGTPRETYYLWGLIGLGQFDLYTDTAGGVEFIVAVPPSNATLGADIATSRFAANRYISQHLWPLGDSITPLRYINIYPKPIPDYNPTSRDHCHGHLGLISDTVDLVTQQRGMTHVTLHDWFLHGGLDYPQWDVVHPEAWAEENVIDYFAVRVARESGNWSAEQANAELLSMYSAYTTTILGTPNDVPLTDFGNITGTAQYILWYKKGALVNYLLDYQVGHVSGGTKSIEDVFRFLHDHVSNTESHRLDVDEFLLAYNLVTGRDFGSFFTAFITGTVPLPFIVLSDTLQIDDAALPDTPQLDSLSLVRLVLQAGLVDTDTDTDGLLDWVEIYIGTDLDDDDSDHDGLADRGEFGAIADGLPGEYGLDVPLVDDPLGDSPSLAAGTDITGLYATGFRDENGVGWLYLTLQEADSQYNPDAWYEIFLSTTDNFYQYRFDEWDSYLWRQEGTDHIEISEGQIEANFRDQLEVLIPLDLLADPLTVTVRGITRYGEQADPSWGLEEVDTTAWGTTSTAAHIFLTDPLGYDTDGDGVSDGVEVRLGSDPTDPASVPDAWPVYLPIVLGTR